jgi:hypothetical protein
VLISALPHNFGRAVLCFGGAFCSDNQGDFATQNKIVKFYNSAINFDTGLTNDIYKIQVFE